MISHRSELLRASPCHSCAYYEWRGRKGLAVIRPGGILHVTVDGVPDVVTRIGQCEDDLLDMADGIFLELVGSNALPRPRGEE
jgi:hypothetical protein